MQTPYTTVAKVGEYLGTTIAEEKEAEVERYIRAMSAQIDNECNRVIYDEDDSKTFVYDGDGTEIIVIKDCIDPAVTVEGESWPVVGYPQNKEYTSRIVSTERFIFPKGRGNIAVTGRQSMCSEVPPEIEFAVTVLVAGVLNGQSKRDKVGTTERIGNYSITYNNEKQLADYQSIPSILSGYKRITV